MENIKFAIYARKSSTGEDRQVLSIESQLDEMKDLAQKLGIRNYQVFTDSQTAHKPYLRPEFMKMIAAIDSGEIQGVLCWKADRLARNPLEGGNITYLLQNSKLKVIQTPYSRYLPTDNTLPLTIELGMANQYSLDLSKNVKRGNKTKVANGGYTGVAPHGYLNDLINHTILPDPDRFDLVRKMWDLYLKGTYSLNQICKIANEEWGFLTYRRKQTGGAKLCISSLYTIFTNRFYYGWIQSGENANYGIHKPMITIAEFEKVQELLRRQGRKGETSYEFSFTGCIKCGECSASITAEEKVKYACPGCRKQNSAKNPHRCGRCGYSIAKEDVAHGHWYKYYRCTKKKGACSQKCFTADALEGQFVDTLSKIEIDPDFERWALQWYKFLNQNSFDEKQGQNELFYSNYQKAEEKIKRLVDMRADGEIDKDRFIASKAEAETDLAHWKSKLSEAEKTRNQSLAEIEEALGFIQGIQKRFREGSVRDKKYIFMKVGSNFLLKDRILTLDTQKAYLAFRELQDDVDTRIEPKDLPSIKENNPLLYERVLTWQGQKESNPR